MIFSTGKRALVSTGTALADVQRAERKPSRVTGRTGRNGGSHGSHGGVEG